ncbi:ABC transporter ATP-binding protein [Sanguibacter suaedae]|uniref:ABC transporter ATP-binding protein n=1 Tax=Sanguibacter suaedae TaxID=2795737 RepID=A0A934M9U1_9MICO|nr:ABC transporter ATP-binding protein [Sanguibacter suaedae]MBI9114940.1 ABC transporter ATP-binding protein [Sanguibacter suaedae]
MTPHALQGSRARRSAVLVARGIKAEPRVYGWAIAASALFGGLTVAVSQVLGAVTDSVVVPVLAGDEPASRAWAGGAALAAVAVALAGSVAARRIWAGIGMANLQSRHRRGVTRRYLELPMSWHRAHPTGQLLSNVSSDVEAATGVFNPLPFALGVCVMILVAAGALLRLDVWLAVAALVVVPAAILANVVFQKHMSPAATRAQQLRAEVADVAHESFEAGVLVKALGTEGREERRFAQRTATLKDANVRVGSVRAVFDPVIEILPSVGTLLVLLVGTLRASAGHVDTGEVVSAAYLVTMLAVPVRAFGWVLGELPRGLVGHDRVSQVMDARGALAPGTVLLDEAGARPEGLDVRVDHVDVTVPTATGPAHLLRDVSLHVPAGSTVAVVGSTGAGKTTLVSLLSRLSDPSEGRVLLDGTDARTVAPGSLASTVAFVAQTTFVFEDTIRANVTLRDVGDDDSPTDDEVWAALETARVADVVRALPDGLDSPLGERGANLSGGQRQRIALARALVRRPRLLVLDDATSAVDPQIEQAILAGLRSSTGTTVVMVAYRMSSVALADHVVHLEGGAVVDEGTHDELLVRDDGYRDLALAYQREAARRTETA